MPADPQRTPVDLAASPRREAFALFRGFAQPWFSVCVRVDAAALKPALARAGVGSFSLAVHFALLQAAQAEPALRLRFTRSADGTCGDGVVQLSHVHLSGTVLREDGSFGFAHQLHTPRFADFALQARDAVEAARRGAPSPVPLPAPDALLHSTTLPWLHFTQFTHARHAQVDTDIPKFAIGRAQAEGARLWLPLAVEVHHALVDGVHVGRFVQAVEALLAAPEGWVG